MTYVVPIDIYMVGLGKGSLSYCLPLGGYLLQNRETDVDSRTDRIANYSKIIK
jgi:hypothetical protein